MSKNKKRVFSTTGFTKELADGIKRPFTIVGVVEATTRTETVSDVQVKQLKRGIQKVTTIEEVDVYEQTLSIGIATLSPADKAIGTAEAGLRIAEGKAAKTPTLVLTASRPYFTKAVVESIIEREAEIFTKNADKVIIVSPKKANKVKVEAE